MLNLKDIMIIKRKAIVRRKTKEVDVTVLVDLDERGYSIKTDIPFFNHMLETFAKHADIKVNIEAEGDLEHHIIEDVAIALGIAIRRALGDKKGIVRFGDAIVPMDDAIAICGLDISGRGYLNFDGNMDENYIHFLDSLCRNAGINAYLSVKGLNSHHIIEACFKAFGVAFGKAIKIVDRVIRSTKETLD